MSVGQPFHRVGIIGTGEIGRRMGSLLNRAGHKVIGYDISAKAAADAAAYGVEAAPGIAEVCAEADLVITCVTDGAALRSVACGPDGLEAHLAPGITVVDTTSAEPWISREIAAVLARRGIPFLDAPVSGGVPAAESGRMNFMVGGDAALLDRVRPVLRHLGSVVTHVGPVGSGHTIKAVNMLALASSMLATAELIALGVRMGAEQGRLLADLDAGPGASYSTRVHFPRFILPGNFASGFTFDLMLKDLSIGIELADRLGVPLFLQRSTFEAYRTAANMGLRGKDNTRIAELNWPVQENDIIVQDPAAFDLAATGFNSVIAAETVALGSAAGLAPATIIEVVAAGSGDSHALREVIGRRLLKGEPSELRLDVIATAHEAVLSSALGGRAPATLVFQSFAIHAASIQSFGRHADASSLLDMLWRWTGQASALSRGASARMAEDGA